MLSTTQVCPTSDVTALTALHLDQSSKGGLVTLNNVALLETVADSRHVVRTQRLSVDSAPATFGELVHGRRARADEWVCMLWSRK